MMMSWRRHHEDHDRHREDVSTSEVARRLDRHMEECHEDKTELHKRLDEHSADTERRHEENRARFARLDRTIYIATGVALAAAWFFSHGSEVLAKFLK